MDLKEACKNLDGNYHEKYIFENIQACELSMMMEERNQVLITCVDNRNCTVQVRTKEPGEGAEVSILSLRR